MSVGRASVAVMETKWCVGCEQGRPVSEFYARTKSADGLQNRCKLCDHQVSRASKLLAKYGLSVDDYDAMLDAQDGRCAICRREPTTRRLAVDHSHVSGTNRELLCDDCNLGLGKLGDSLERLRSAVAYLERHENRP